MECDFDSFLFPVVVNWLACKVKTVYTSFPIGKEKEVEDEEVRKTIEVLLCFIAGFWSVICSTPTEMIIDVLQRSARLLSFVAELEERITYLLLTRLDVEAVHGVSGEC